MIGMIHNAESLFFRVDCGTAAAGENAYELSIDVGTSAPIIRSLRTGKWWTLGWKDLLAAAVEDGIDDAGTGTNTATPA